MTASTIFSIFLTACVASVVPPLVAAQTATYYTCDNNPTDAVQWGNNVKSCSLIDSRRASRRCAKTDILTGKVAAEVCSIECAPHYPTGCTTVTITVEATHNLHGQSHVYEIYDMYTFEVVWSMDVGAIPEGDTVVFEKTLPPSCYAADYINGLSDYTAEIGIQYTDIATGNVLYADVPSQVGPDLGEGFIIGLDEDTCDNVVPTPTKVTITVEATHNLHEQSHVYEIYDMYTLEVVWSIDVGAIPEGDTMVFEKNLPLSCYAADYINGLSDYIAEIDIQYADIATDGVLYADAPSQIGPDLGDSFIFGSEENTCDCL